jgi:iron-sulfur cluster assembly protein
MENTSVLPVKITPNALEEIKQLFDTAVTDASKMLRIGVKGGGCSGLSYVLEMDERKERDEVFDVDGIPCIIDPAHSMYLFGMEIDWKKGLDARGFVFNNPNAAATCGCGTSFSI